MAASYIRLDNRYLGFIAQMAVCLVVPNTLFYLLFHGSEEFIFYKDLAGRIVKKIFSK